MKKLFYLIVLFFSAAISAQTVTTAEQAEKTTDPKALAGFIKTHPSDPKIPFLKQKLIAMVLSDQPKAERAAAAKPKITPMNPHKMQAEIARSQNGTDPNPEHQRTAAMLTHLFNSDPNDKDAIIQIENKSKCNLVVKISGKKFYNLNVPPHNSNYIMVDKGTYTLTTMVCDAKYSSVKTITKDIVVALNTHQ